MIYVVWNVGGKKPVIATVPEQIFNGHGSMRESVYKQGLQDAFSIVQNPARCSNTVAQIQNSELY